MNIEKPRVKIYMATTNNNTEPRIGWQDNHYRVIKSNSVGGVIHDLPGQPTVLSGDFARQGSDVLIFSEPRGGVRDLLNWWYSCLDNGGLNWVQAQGSNWEPGVWKWPDATKKQRAFYKIESHKSKPRSLAEAIEKFGQNESIQERINALQSWSDLLRQPFTLVIIDLMDRGEKHAADMAKAIRLIRDEGICKNIRFIIVSQTEDLFMDTARESGLFAVCNGYRPPLFTEKEIRTLAAWIPDSDKAIWYPSNLTGDALEYFMAYTGGHPLVVQHLMQRLQKMVTNTATLDHPKKPHRVTVTEVEEAARRLRIAPPETVHEWQNHLKTLLCDDIELIEKIRAYVKDYSLSESVFPPSNNERGLFLAGWLSHNPLTKRWGITSEFHAHLAREVLDKL